MCLVEAAGTKDSAGAEAAAVQVARVDTGVEGDVDQLARMPVWRCSGHTDSCLVHNSAHVHPLVATGQPHMPYIGQMACNGDVASCPAHSSGRIPMCSCDAACRDDGRCEPCCCYTLLGGIVFGPNKCLVDVVHDETTTYGNEGDVNFWCNNDLRGKVLYKKGKGLALMLSGFMCPCHPRLLQRPLSVQDGVEVYPNAKTAVFDRVSLRADTTAAEAIAAAQLAHGGAGSTSTRPSACPRLTWSTGPLPAVCEQPVAVVEHPAVAGQQPVPPAPAPAIEQPVEAAEQPVPPAPALVIEQPVEAAEQSVPVQQPAALVDEPSPHTGVPQQLERAVPDVEVEHRAMYCPSSVFNKCSVLEIMGDGDCLARALAVCFNSELAETARPDGYPVDPSLYDIERAATASMRGILLRAVVDYDCAPSGKVVIGTQELAYTSSAAYAEIHSNPAKKTHLGDIEIGAYAKHAGVEIVVIYRGDSTADNLNVQRWIPEAAQAHERVVLFHASNPQPHFRVVQPDAALTAFLDPPPPPAAPPRPPPPLPPQAPTKRRRTPSARQAAANDMEAFQRSCSCGEPLERRPSIKCMLCHCWFHVGCTGLSTALLRKNKKLQSTFICDSFLCGGMRNSDSDCDSDEDESGGGEGAGGGEDSDYDEPEEPEEPEGEKEEDAMQVEAGLPGPIASAAAFYEDAGLEILPSGAPAGDSAASRRTQAQQAELETAVAGQIQTWQRRDKKKRTSKKKKKKSRRELAVEEDPDCIERAFLRAGDSTVVVESGGGTWFVGDDLVLQFQYALQVFDITHPGCSGMFTFDNASGHSAYAMDALRVSIMTLNPSDQPEKLFMRPGWYVGTDGQRVVQDMVQTVDGTRVNVGVKVVLMERGLWKPGMRLKCKKDEVTGVTCPPGSTDCCASAVLASQPDFLEQSCAVEETVAKHNAAFGTNHFVRFLPKFHPELNPIERLWAALKHHVRANCAYSAEGLRAQLPKSLLSVPAQSYGKYYRYSHRMWSAYRYSALYQLCPFLKHHECSICNTARPQPPLPGSAARTPSPSSQQRSTQATGMFAHAGR